MNNDHNKKIKIKFLSKPAGCARAPPSARQTTLTSTIFKA